MGGTGLRPTGRFAYGGARLLIPLLMLSLLAPSIALGEPTILARERASLGGTNPILYEPSIAAGPDLVVVVYHSKNEGVRYAYREPGASEWVEGGLIESWLNPGPGDPSVTYDARHNTFVAAARVGQTGSAEEEKVSYLLTSRFDPVTRQFGAWVIRREYHGSGTGFDKPWIVAGDPWVFPGGQELYITCTDDVGAHAALFRSIDSGATWTYSRIYLFGDPNQPVAVSGTLQPAVWQERDLYLAYINPVTEPEEDAGEADGVTAVHGEIRILRGTDMGEYAVYWEPLYGVSGAPLVIITNETDVSGRTPGNLKGWVIPYLVADPSDPDCLYLLYHDTVYAGSADVNVYARTLTRNPSTGRWIVTSRVKVNNDDDPTGQFDQFTPVATVDGSGRVHVIFYDDRAYDQPDGPEATTAKFHMYYAYSETQGQTWENWELFAEPEEPALDWALVPKLDPREYNAITWYGNRIWNAYTSTWTGQANKAVVSWNPIDW